MKGYIPHLHAFRGFAILNIVGAHAWSFMIFWTGGLDSKGLEGLFYLTETIFHGGTLYFAIISGLLFSKVLSQKSWQDFYRSKFLNVFLPYVFVTILMTAAYWRYYIENAQQNGLSISFWGSVGENLLAGTGSIQFWYVPVLFVLFAITPILSAMHRRWPWIILLFCAIPLFVSRSTFPDFLTFQTFVYFIGAYALGMGLGHHYDKVMQYVKQHISFIVVVTVIVSITIGFQYFWQYQVDGIYSSRQSLIYIQKVLLCLLVLHWFHSLEKKAQLPGWLMSFGTYAFSIYFLHVLFIGFLILTIQPYLEGQRTASIIGGLGMANMVIGVGGSVLSAWLVKKIVGRYSRMLLGS